MLCHQCQSLSTADGEQPLRPTLTNELGLGRVAGLMCARCGAVLPSEDATGRLLDKLTQLARFGLAAEAHPLLVSSRGGERD